MSTSPVMTVTDELLAELDSKTEKFVGFGIRSDTVARLVTELRRLRAEKAELAKEAGRYNWLRNQSMEYRQNGPAAIMAEASGEKGTFLELDDLDSAIDTAMATQ